MQSWRVGKTGYFTMVTSALERHRSLSQLSANNAMESDKVLSNYSRRPSHTAASVETMAAAALAGSFPSV